MAKSEIVVPKTWRSEFYGVALFFILSIITIWLSKTYPEKLVISGELFTIFSYQVKLHLPILVMLPFFILVTTAVRIFNVRYVIDPDGAKSIIGRISLQQRITRVRFEDVRSIEVNQSLLDRLLGIGAVSIGTAGTFGTEVTFSGVAAPKEIQEMLQKERDARLGSKAEVLQASSEE